jgi:hypothetical protein
MAEATVCTHESENGKKCHPGSCDTEVGAQAQGLYLPGKHSTASATPPVLCFVFLRQP